MNTHVIYPLDPGGLSPLVFNLRAHARMLTGDQITGDQLAASAVQAALDCGALTGDPVQDRLVMLKQFAAIWASAALLPGAVPQDQPGMAPLARQALLLRVVEDLTLPQIALVMDRTQFDVADLAIDARSAIETGIHGRVIVVARDAGHRTDAGAELLSGEHHQVVAKAANCGAAARLLPGSGADLILVDLEGAGTQSGINALIADCAVPVVVVTSESARFLSAKGIEPAFVIARPLSEDKVQSVVSQALWHAAKARVAV